VAGAVVRPAAVDDLSDWLRIAGRAARTLADVVVDAGKPTLPLLPAAIATPAGFADLLARSEDGPHPLPGNPIGVSATALESPSSNCRNTVFELAWPDEALERGAPASVFVKQPSAELATRLFAGMVGFWSIECAVCRNLAEAVPVPMPRVHAVAEHRSRFALVMENLHERAGVHLFVNADLLDGVDEATAVRCLRTLARLHAHFESFSAAERERCLSVELHPFLSPTRMPFMLALNRRAVLRCHTYAPTIFGYQDVALYERALANWDSMSTAWYNEPLTLAHGDSHLGNFFDDGEEMGLIDFQGAHWSSGLRDVVYFLVNSMPARSLETVERDLVATYCDERAQAGSPVDPDDAWDQYRGFSFQALMTAVVSLGLGSFKDSDAVMRVMLERSVAAVRRLEFDTWLDGRIGG
jgi:hypothetical protein